MKGAVDILVLRAELLGGAPEQVNDDPVGRVPQHVDRPVEEVDQIFRVHPGDVLIGEDAVDEEPAFAWERLRVGLARVLQLV